METNHARDVKQFSDSLKITDDREEMAQLGRKFLLDHPEAYSDDFLQSVRDWSLPLFGSEDEFISNLYCAVYCQQVYGTSFPEFSSFHFAQKSHEERIRYVTWDSRFLYLAFLNRKAANHFLDNKYEAYTLLKPFYKREAMLLSGEGDYEDFCSFVRRNPDIFVKPNNLELAEGVHPLEYSDDGDLRLTFENLLQEAADISSTDIIREIDHRLILEETIVPSDFIRQMNPAEMALLRVTTISVKGNIHFFYPCLRLLVGDGIEKSGEDYSYVALIDSDTGQVITNGKNGFGDTDVNPITGQKIQGMQMPDWEELKDMLKQAAQMLPDTRYIGWDVTHTDKGWCIIEGNPGGEFFYQMCAGHGVREELEDLIGLRLPYDAWKNPLFFSRNKPKE